MLTKLNIEGDHDDARVVELLEGEFARPLSYFARAGFNYWHVRVRGIEGVVFVRRDERGEFHLYGPVRGRSL